MLHKTKGIVLSFVKYRETSIIVKIFTEQFGLQSYIVNGIRSSRSRQKMSFFRPLSLLEMVVYRHHSKDINRISEYKTAYIYQDAPYHPVKSAIIWFLNEFLLKILNIESSDPALFQFIFNSLKTLDNLKSGFENFHLQFLLKLSPYLGFHPSSEYELHWTNDDLINDLTNKDYETPIALDNSNRRKIIEETLNFYTPHYDNLKNLKSLEVLKQVQS